MFPCTFGLPPPQPTLARAAVPIAPWDAEIESRLTATTVRAALVTSTNSAAQSDERAAAHAFWLSNDSWRSILAFSSQQDLFHVRASNRSIKQQVDHAVTTVTLRGVDIPAFIQSNSFAKLRTLRLEHAREEDVLLLADYLDTHPRSNLTLEFAHFDLLTTRAITALPGLPLGRLHLHGLPAVDGLDALAACRFPVTLHGHLWGGLFLGAVLRIPTLEKLVAYGEVIYQSCQHHLANHPTLAVLHIGIVHQADTIDVLARLPRLRELCLNMGMSTPAVLTPRSALALAASPTLETLTIVSALPLSEESLTALSESQSLLSLTMPLFQGMRALADMHRLQTLAFNDFTSLNDAMVLDVETIQNIATAPSLQSISFPGRPFEPGALVSLFDNSGASSLEFNTQIALNVDERRALMANTRLSVLLLRKGVVQQSDVALLCHHPTLKRLCIGAAEYRRLPDHAYLTLQHRVD